MEKKTVKKGAAPVGLYLRIGPDLAPDILIPDLRQAFFVINASDYERNMHALEITGDAANPRFAEAARILFELARANGIACIWRGHAADAKELGADGVLALDEAGLKTGKEIFGKDGIVGLYCGTSQELACNAHDGGADFVSFGTGGPGLPPPDLMRFWTILSDKPMLVEGNITNDYCAFLIEKGASFIDAGAYIWSHGSGIMQGTVNMLHAIDLALDGITRQ